MTDWRLRAHRRVRSSARLREHFDVIFYDWPVGDEHYQWIATAPIAEIVAWAEVVQKAFRAVFYKLARSIWAEVVKTA